MSIPVTKRWRVYKNDSTEFSNYIGFTFTKTHPSPDPDTFQLTVSGKANVDYFDKIDFRKDNHVEFVGYVEKIKYEVGSDGLITIISGRCNKVLMWKKWTERFADNRENIKGFFGKVYADELVKFLLRNPISDIPSEDEEWSDYPLQKIGWGINPASWSCYASSSAIGTYPDYVKLRRVGFYWRNRGVPLVYTNLTPNGTVGSSDWTEHGGTGASVVNSDDGDTSYIKSDDANETSYGYKFSDLPSDASSVGDGVLEIKARTTFAWQWQLKIVRIKVEISTDNGSNWNVLGYFDYYGTNYQTAIFHLTGYTVSEINNLAIRLTRVNDSVPDSYVTYMKVRIPYSTGGKQYAGDYFQINFGETRNRVCGIIIQSRHSSDQYARNYKIEVATQDYAGSLGNDGEWNASTYWGSSSTTNDNWIAGPLTNNTGDTIEIKKVRMYLYIYGENCNKTMKAVIYKVPSGTPTIPDDLDLVGTSDAITSGTEEEWRWYEFNFSTPVSIANNEEFYVGLLGCNFGSTWAIGQVASGTQFPNEYLKYEGSCNASDPFGTADVSGEGNNRPYMIKIYYGGNWTQKASKTGNTAQDIIHSWSPCQASMIKITITNDDTEHGWEITQIYVYEADDKDFTIYESTISPNITIDTSQIVANSDNPTIKPINIPFSRLTDALDQVNKATFDSSYNLWEWWLDTNNKFYWKNRRGSDKSSTVKFRYGYEIEDAIRTRSIGKTVQRVRLVGGAEGRRQDEISSNWQKNDTAIGNINTFYEEVISEKTVTDRETANEWSKVYLNKLKDVIEEFEIYIESDPYDGGTYDVGDDVYIEYTSIGIDGSYRIKRKKVKVDDEGEHVVLTVTNAWQDITDKIADLYKKIRQLEMSSNIVEDWIAEGENQDKISAEKFDNLWNFTRKVDEANEFQDVDPANQDTYTTTPANFGTIDGRTVEISKDYMTVKGTTTAGAGGITEIYLSNRTVKWSLNPRFTVDFEIIGEFKKTNGNEDHVYICISDDDDDWFGFRVLYDGANYVLSAVLKDSGMSQVVRDLMNINKNERHVLEARVDWTNKIVTYYVDGVAKAIIEFSDGVEDESLYPMHVDLTTWQPDPAEEQAVVDFWVWKTQALKEVEET